MQTGLLPLGHESAVEFLNAEHPKLNRPPFDLETEEGTDRSNAETDIIDGAAQALVRDA